MRIVAFVAIVTVAFLITYISVRSRKANLTVIDLEQVLFLKEKYIPEIDAYRRLGMITEAEYQEEMRLLYEYTERMEDKS